jgi:hypothetical protein
MDDARLDALAQNLAAGHSRRISIRLLAGLAIGNSLARADLVEGKRKKRKRKRFAFNEFGCVNVGGKCRGRDSVCCSGRCRGKKPKPGKADRRHCVAHDTGGCMGTDRVCPSVLCTTSIGHAGGCTTTTGNAPYCADFVTTTPCNKDADCVPFCGPLAACFVCNGVSGGHCAGPGECTT